MYLDNLKALFSDPNDFFRSLSGEGYWHHLKFFMIIFFIANLLKGISLSSSYFISLILTIIFASIIPFILAGSFYLPIRLFGGKQGFFNTFKSIIYGSSVFLVYEFVATAVSLIFKLSTGTALGKVSFYTLVNYFFLGKGWLTTFSSPGYSSIVYKILIVFLLVGLIHALIVYIKGIKSLQGVTNKRAIASALIGLGIIIGLSTALTILFIFLMDGLPPFLFF